MSLKPLELAHVQSPTVKYWKPFTHSPVPYKDNFSDRNDSRNLVPDKHNVMCVTGAPKLFVAATSAVSFSGLFYDVLNLRLRGFEW
jgi:hypothetical protein